MQRISLGCVIAFDSCHKGNKVILAHPSREVGAQLFQTWQMICTMTYIHNALAIITMQGG